VLKGFNSNNPVNNITLPEWKAYFEKLLNNVNVSVNDDFNKEVVNFLKLHEYHCDECDLNNPEELNIPFTYEEIVHAISALPNGKAPAADGIIIEMLKYTIQFISPILLILFNKILESGVFPDDWARALIIPLLKKGAVNDPNNYRGISLCSSLNKVFMKILYISLSKWVENNNILGGEQAGFRKARSTTDNIFVFQCLIQKYLSKKGGRCYSLYIDFSKAFDSVPHNLLWFKLLNIGIHGNIIKVLQSMYSKLESAIVSREGTSEFFRMLNGTRQGCLVSPPLFII
jgi:hypothetical protein